MKYEWIPESAIVFGAICESCGKEQRYNDPYAKGLKRFCDNSEDYLLCSDCHPAFEENEEE